MKLAAPLRIPLCQEPPARPAALLCHCCPTGIERCRRQSRPRHAAGSRRRSGCAAAGRACRCGAGQQGDGKMTVWRERHVLAGGSVGLCVPSIIHLCSRQANRERAPQAGCPSQCAHLLASWCQPMHAPGRQQMRPENSTSSPSSSPSAASTAARTASLAATCRQDLRRLAGCLMLDTEPFQTRKPVWIAATAAAGSAPISQAAPEG